MPAICDHRCAATALVRRCSTARFTWRPARVFGRLACARDRIVVGELAPDVAFVRHETARVLARHALPRSHISTAAQLSPHRGLRNRHPPVLISRWAVLARIRLGPGDDLVPGRLGRVLDRASRSGAIRRHLPIYVTEFGIQSFPDRLAGREPAQGRELRSISELIAWRNPRVRAFSEFLTRTTPTSGVFRRGCALRTAGASPATRASACP